MFTTGQTVRLTRGLTKFRGRTRDVLPKGLTFVIHAATTWAASPEYTLRDPATHDLFPNVPEFCLEPHPETTHGTGLRSDDSRA